DRLIAVRREDAREEGDAAAQRVLRVVEGNGDRVPEGVNHDHDRREHDQPVDKTKDHVAGLQLSVPFYCCSYPFPLLTSDCSRRAGWRTRSCRRPESAKSRI